MCGRFAFISTKELKERFMTENDVDFEPIYNAAPGNRLLTISKNSPNKVEIMKWGLIPHWAKDPKIGYKMINARSEDVSSKPSFREPFKNKRCLIPANGFYEWKDIGEKKKQPHYIKFTDNRLFAFAGLYDIWTDAEGLQIKTFTIMTTAPNKLVAKIHNRMPVILDAESEEKWLDHNSEPEKLKELLKPLDSEEMEAYKISMDVNSPRNNNPNIIEKV